MNHDNVFDHPLIKEHKGLLTILTTVALSFFTIFWLYKGLRTSNNPNINTNNVNSSLNINQTQINQMNNV